MRIKGKVRTRATQAELEATAESLTVPFVTPSGHESRLLVKLPRAWATFTSLSVSADGAGGAAWDADLVVGRLDSKGAFRADPTAETEATTEATTEAIGRHVLRQLRLVRAR
jgi:hypothetical protein